MLPRPYGSCYHGLMHPLSLLLESDLHESWCDWRDWGDRRFLNPSRFVIDVLSRLLGIVRVEIRVLQLRM